MFSESAERIWSMRARAWSTFSRSSSDFAPKSAVASLAFSLTSRAPR